jgi:uncharacterized membrane protein YbhN (UPF0104 family)
VNSNARDMTNFFDAVRTFFEQLAAVEWAALGIALGFHVIRLLLRTVAWRNILQAAFRPMRVRWRSAAGAYFASVGLNSILPARAGDGLRAYLIKHRIEGSTYPTIAATLVVETLFDSVVGIALLLWAIASGALPGLDVLPSLPSVDWAWPIDHPRWAAVIGGVIVVALATLLVLAARKVREFRRRFAQGFAILGRPWRRYLLGVAFWQAWSWVFRLGSIYFFLDAFHVDATIYNAFLVQVVLSLSTVIPFTPGGAGTQQGLLAYTFKEQRGLIVSFSVGMNIATVVANLLLGFVSIALMMRTLNIRTALRRAKEATRETSEPEPAVEPPPSAR